MLKASSCQLCGRLTKRGTTEHHLVPRTCHSNKWFKKRLTRQEMHRTIDLCHDCHGAIHRLIPDEKQLGRNYHTRDQLLAHPELANFIAWVRKRK